MSLAAVLQTSSALLSQDGEGAARLWLRGAEHSTW